MSTLSTHVLDTAAGRPARGIDVRLETRGGELLGEGVTDDDGRVGAIGRSGWSAGAYVLRFDTGTYVDGFYPRGRGRVHRRRSRPALPRAGAAEPLRLLDLPWQLTWIWSSAPAARSSTAPRSRPASAIAGGADRRRDGVRRPAGGRARGRPCADDEVLLPGLVDTHVHVNEPGRTEWEGFATATRAAAAGGVTTILDMPLNSIPATTTVAALEIKRLGGQGKVFVDVGFWGGAVPGNLGDLAAPARRGRVRVQVLPARLRRRRSSRTSSPTQFALAMDETARLGALMIVHAEDGDAPRRAALWTGRTTPGSWRRDRARRRRPRSGWSSTQAFARPAAGRTSCT